MWWTFGKKDLPGKSSTASPHGRTNSAREHDTRRNNRDEKELTTKRGGGRKAGVGQVKIKIKSKFERSSDARSSTPGILAS
jgi:hypothetical protein